MVKQFVVGLVLFCMTLPLSAATKSINVCLIGSELFPLWRAPGEETKRYAGINIDLMYTITKQLNIEINWIRVPFARCLHYLKSGEVDFLNVASFRNERQEYGVYPMKNGQVDTSRRMKFDTYYAFIQKDSKITWDGEKFFNLNGLPFASEIGASINPRLESMGLSVVLQPTAEFSFEMLKRKRVQVVVTNQYNGLKFKSHNIRRLEPPMVEKPYYLVSSKQFYQANSDLVERIWYLSGDLQEREYQRVLQFYASSPSWPSD